MKAVVINRYRMGAATTNMAHTAQNQTRMTDSSEERKEVSSRFDVCVSRSKARLHRRYGDDAVGREKY